MKPSFHPGHAYVTFDRIVRAVEGWLADRVPSVAGFDEAVVRERLAQRVADIALPPFAAICARRIWAGEALMPAPEQALDCGGVVLHPTTGKTTISLILFASALFEFAIHWAHILGAILLGTMPHRAKDRRSATLVLGIGAESLFYEGNDERFVKYCRSGPITPLTRGQRHIVQCAALTGEVTDPDFAYDRFPLQALIRETRLGAAGRAALIKEHLSVPWMFLRATVASPLLALLARDFAYINAVRVLDLLRMIEAVVVTNSFYPAQPLWMRSSAARTFPVHMVWYAGNIRPFVYVRDRLASDEPRYRHIRVDEMWVWKSGHKAYLEKLGLPGPIHVVGSILWYLPEAKTKPKDTDIRIVMFDVTPVREDVALRIGLADNYYSTANMIRFVEEAISVCHELQERTGKCVRLLLKPKRGYNATSHDPRYIEFIRRLSAPGGSIEVVPFGANMYTLLAGCDLAIVAPFSSPAHVASEVGVRAIYFDPTKELVPTFDPEPLVEFASGREELLRIALKAVAPSKVHEAFAKH